MRRKIGYILLAGALLLGAACTIGPTIVGLDTDVSLSTGRDLVFKISEYGTTQKGVTGKYIDNDGYAAVNAVANEFESRLSGWGTSGVVTKEGYDTVRVSLRAQQNDSTEYSYLEKYLPFSGGDLAVDASITTGGKNYSHLPGWDNLFDGQTARIEYITTSTGKLPVVVIPVNPSSSAYGDDGDFAKLLTYCKDNSTEADDSKSTQASYCLVTFWANKQSGDKYETAEASAAEGGDANVASRLFFAERQDYAWYDADTTTTTDDHKEVQLIPSSAAIQTGTYDSNKAGSAAKAAKLYMSMLNASSYKNIGSGYDVTFAFESAVAATAETLVTYTAWGLTPYWGATLISSLIAFAIGALMLVLFYGLGSLAIISNVAFAIMGTLLFFVYFHAQFGIGAIVGIVLVALEAAFGGSYYFSKVKEQLYLGRSVKKAHQEASKKAMWPTIDGGLLGIVLGLCVYSLVPDVVGKVGLALVFGSFFSVFANLLLLRLEGWLLSNDSDVDGEVGKVYNVDPSKIPNALKDEKPSYFGPFAEKNFQKPSKWLSIAMGALALASIVGLGVFSATSTTYNTAASSSDTTVMYVEYRMPSNVSDPSVNKLTSVDDLETNVLYKISYKGTAFVASDFLDITMNAETIDAKTGYTIYLTDEEKTYNVAYFTVKFASHFDEGGTYDFAFGGVSYTSLFGDDGVMAKAVSAYAGDYAATSVKNVAGAPGTPSMASLWLGLGVGLLADLVYMVIRYRPSRGLSAGALSFGSALIVCGFYTLTRLPVTPIVSAAAIAAGFLTLLYSIYILGKERETYKDSRERDKDNLAFRSACLASANKQGAGDLVVMLLLTAFVSVFYYGFAPAAWSNIFLGLLVGLVVIGIFLLTLLTPASLLLAKLFSRFHIDFHFKKKEPLEGQRKKSAEPEEAVFIGIND
jgi:preprotein translocase subunit SecF